MKSMRILVCGSRNWINRERIKEILEKYPHESVIIHGGCRGADQIAGNVARELKMKEEVYNAEWGKYGRSAGPIRNQKMIDDGKPDLILAFHEDMKSSKGTLDMVKRGSNHRIPVKLFK